MLENDILQVKIRSKGAELFSIRNKETGLEYLWSGDPAFWAKTSPILFPIVGTLNDDAFLYRNKRYTLSRHGFARDMEFEISESTPDRAMFTLSSSQETMAKYPFAFRLRVKYEIEDDTLSVNYLVENEGNEDMYFSVGGHPAFRVPLIEGTNYEDYRLVFSQVENVQRWPISDRGLIEVYPGRFLDNSDTIQLTRTLFEKDAIVLKQLRSNRVSIQSHLHHHGLDFYFDGFPFLGIWAAPNADFVCLEPWCGIADSVDHNQEFTTKEGIEKMGPGQLWSRVWKVKFY